VTKTGLDRFVETLESCTRDLPPGWRGSAPAINRLGEECAFIRLQDMRRPLRFLRQMSGSPPLRFGATGFNPDLVDDGNPVRHYVAFVVVGFWLPMLLGVLVLYGWEVLGFIRYWGHWSPKDVRSGMIGLRHGRAARRMGASVLPELVRRDLGIPADTDSTG